MAGTWKWYLNGLAALMNGQASLTTNLKVALLTEEYYPDPVNHIYWSSASPYEVTGLGYTAGGLSMSSSYASVDSTFTPVVNVNLSYPVWFESSIEAKTAAIYYNGGSSSTSKRLLCYLVDDVGAESDGGSFYAYMPYPTFTFQVEL